MSDEFAKQGIMQANRLERKMADRKPVFNGLNIVTAANGYIVHVDSFDPHGMLRNPYEKTTHIFKDPADVAIHVQKVLEEHASQA